MRRSEEAPMDPEVVAELEVIDLTLAGEPVDPEYAELAELALMLQMERAAPSAEFARLLDARATRRFVSLEPRRSRGLLRRSPGWAWLQSPGVRAGLVGALAAAAVAAFVVISPHGGSSSSNTTSAASATTAQRSAGSVTRAGSSSPGSGAIASPSSSSTTATHASGAAGAPSASTTSSTSGSASGLGRLTGSQSNAPSSPPAPDTSGRKVVQSAQLTLTAANDRIDAVSQEVFDVVAAQHGIVMSSHIMSITGKNAGSASFALSIPTGNLETALQSLSSLRYAHVVSRTDATQDVTKTYRTDRQRLQDAQALRTSLLKQLAQAGTQTQIDSLKAQLQDAERQIAAAQSSVNLLQHRVSFSSLSVQLYSGTPPVVRPVHRSGGFTLGGAAHDAGRVLVVAAGVIMIAAAALIPIALLAALVLWLAQQVRRRRREQALDQA